MTRQVYAKKIRFFVLHGMALGTLLFIFANSLTPASASASVSGSLFERLKEIFGFLPFFNHHFLRKTAHFCEYALLGAIVAFYPAFAFRGKAAAYAAAFLFGAPVALIDEGLQLFAEGRGASLTDSLLDYSGYIFGILVGMALTAIVKRICEKRRLYRESI